MGGESRVDWGMRVVLLLLLTLSVVTAEFRAGASAVDISPPKLPVIQNGGFIESTLSIVLDTLHARAIVLDDGNSMIAIVVVDSCMMPRELIDKAKDLAVAETGIRKDRILVSATHTHSAPSVMNHTLGARGDPHYMAFLPGKIAEAIRLAKANLQPAQVGSAKIDASDLTANRRWIMHPDKLSKDPFGALTVRANMHPGHNNPNAMGPSGPIDPWLSMLSIQTREGKPLALLANFSMHYFSGHAGVSSDYFGRFAKEMGKRLAPDDSTFVAALSQGTSGDLFWADYSRDKRRAWNLEEYTNRLADKAMTAVETISHRSDLPLRMAEKRIELAHRQPSEERLQWAQKLVDEMGDRVVAKNRPEVYAQQAFYLKENPSREVVLQSIGIGDLTINALPNEVYAITGLKLKAGQGERTVFNVSLANGASGYIPPKEQHALGGYTTWPARTAGLEVGAERRIVEELGLLAQRPLDMVEPPSMYSKAIGASPSLIDQWRMGELDLGDGFSSGVAPGVPGVSSSAFGSDYHNRCVHFAGGKFTHTRESPTGDYSLSLWFWNALPLDVRETTGILFASGGDQVSISRQGKLVAGSLDGESVIDSKRWYHLAFVRKGDAVKVFLNGRLEIEGAGPARQGGPLYFAGDRENTANFEGKMDEVALFDRALTEAKVSEQVRVAQLPESPPLSPKQSMKSIHVRDGFELELVAAEPFVRDPVAIDWDADGKLWVSEMADYPYGIDGKGKAGGRVRWLEDADANGVFEKSVLFLDGLSFPTSVMPWRDGVLITAAPDILFARDTDGDGRADEQEVLFTGFIEGNQQLRVNSLRWGLDGWIYAASGGHHAGFGVKTEITSTKTGKKTALGSRDFKFRPDSGELEALSGPSQYGRVRDDWGNWFGVQNSYPLWHYVLPDHYLRRNAFHPAGDPRRQLRGQAPRVFPNKPPQKRFHGFDHAGRYTSACGISIYRDVLLFPSSPERMHAFTCEPFHNVVQHHVLDRDGVTFTAARGDDGEKDFFASADRWCRPVSTRTGPDGALYVVDMYRYMIEHPDWLPQEGQDELRPFYRHGEDRGRIYRIIAKERETFARIDFDDLVRDMGSSNGHVRDTVHRLLMERGDRKAAEEVVKTQWIPMARFQAYSALQSLPGTFPWLSAAVDHDPNVRRLAAHAPEMLERLCEDDDVRVRLQVALTAGSVPGEEAAAALISVAKQDGSDPFVHAAVMSSADLHFDALVAALIDDERFAKGLAVMAARRGGEGSEAMIETFVSGSASSMELCAAWLDHLEEPIVDPRLEELFGRARTLVQDAATDEAHRVAAIGLLARGEGDDAPVLAALLSPIHPLALQLAATARLRALGDGASFGYLREALSASEPTTREAILAALLSRKDWCARLLDAVEEVPAYGRLLDASRRQQLSGHPDKAVSQRAKTLFAQSTSSRLDVVAALRPALALDGDTASGKVIFEARCALCHQVGDVGKAIGPDLRSITDKSAAGLLTAIVDPSRNVEPKYLSYLLDLPPGETLYGLIRAETGNSLIVAQLDGSERTILRSSVKTLKSTDRSLMPDGLEADLGVQEIADLIGYVQSLGE